MTFHFCRWKLAHGRTYLKFLYSFIELNLITELSSDHIIVRILEVGPNGNLTWTRIDARTLLSEKTMFASSR